ncbi:MAG: ribonuclease PH [bacterium]|nr:ribonuclease PH [bacterium]
MSTSRRKDGRTDDQLREIILHPNWVKNVPGSILVEQGDTRVQCTAIHEGRVPSFMRNQAKIKGWVQAEYAMLPGSTGQQQRSNRERHRVNNRNIEIQRFISRALRTTFNLKKIAGNTIHIDTDVLQADGGTRCAAINGGMFVLAKALRYMVFENIIPHLPELEFLAAVSVGVKNNNILVDLDYYEDARVDADINVVSNEKGNIVEVQAFGEERTIRRDIFQQVIEIAVEKNLAIIHQLKECLETGTETKS